MSAGKIGMISDVITVSDGVALSHPSESFALYGQSEAENTLLKAFNSGQLAHAWLISGQKGIGKATLAYRFARFLLACGSDKDDRATENIGFSEDGLVFLYNVYEVASYDQGLNLMYLYLL